MDTRNHLGLGNGLEESSYQADELLQAAERALFDATSRLQEALVLIDQQGVKTSADTIERVRQWSALIHHGLNRLDASSAARVIAAMPRAGVLEA